MARDVFAQLWRVYQLQPYLIRLDLIHALVTSRLDYCNILYKDLHLNIVCKLQLVQNAVTWVVTGAGLQWNGCLSNSLASSCMVAQPIANPPNNCIIIYMLSTYQFRYCHMLRCKMLY